MSTKKRVKQVVECLTEEINSNSDIIKQIKQFSDFEVAFKTR